MPPSVGSKVWLEGTNLRLPSNLTPKLAPKRYRPFEVAAQISKVAYKLRLPPSWKIHDIFHVSLLTPYKETPQHGPNFLEPPPDIVEGEPEWEVAKILQECSHSRGKKKQYLVRWKGYSPAHDEWVSAEDLHAPELLAEFHNQASSIRTLFLNDVQSCLPHSTIDQNPNQTTLILTPLTMSRTPAASPTLQEGSTGTTPSPNQENSPPPLFIPPPPSPEMGRSMLGLRSPLIDIENISGATNTLLFLNATL
jgi:hypothetical protein